MTDKPANDPKPLEVAPEPGGDPVSPAPAEAAAPAPAAETGEEKPTRAPVQSDVDRASIAERFAKRRAETNAGLPFVGSVVPALQGGSVTNPPPEPEPPPQQQQTQVTEGHPEGAPSDSAPKRVKVVVRREERELTQEELIAAAQKGLAGESYFNEARQLLEETKRVVSSRPHPGDTAPAAEPSNPDDPSHQTDPFEDAADKIQFGEKKEVAEALRTTTASVAKDAAREVVYEQQRSLDVGRATTAFNAFKQSNEELLSDPNAEVVLERYYHDGLREDLKKLGYPDDKIPRDRARLVEAHRFHRIHGHGVRETKDLLEASKEGFVKWRGGGQQQQQPQPQQQRQVVVQVDRTERRSSIPQQPSRAAVPPQLMAQEQSTPSTRTSAVQQMRKSRGLVTAV